MLTFTYTVLATDYDDDGIYTYEDPFTYGTDDSIVGLVNGLAAVNFISGTRNKYSHTPKSTARSPTRKVVQTLRI